MYFCSPTELVCNTKHACLALGVKNEEKNSDKKLMKNSFLHFLGGLVQSLFTLILNLSLSLLFSHSLSLSFCLLSSYFITSMLLSLFIQSTSISLYLSLSLLFSHSLFLSVSSLPISFHLCFSLSLPPIYLYLSLSLSLCPYLPLYTFILTVESNYITL